MNTHNKLLKLQRILRDMGEVTVAYSGGVDSSFLLKVSTDTLKSKSLGVLAVSPTFPSREYERAISAAKSMGALVQVIYTHELEDDNFVKNPVNRCYFCKSELFDSIAKIAEEERFSNFVDGSNMDDLGDHRPGMKALKERNVRSPLQEAGLTKEDIRAIAHEEYHLSIADKPSMACLASRFPYGEAITSEKLQRVDGAEKLLRELGFRQVRVRSHGRLARVEVDADRVHELAEPGLRERVNQGMKEQGFLYVTLDLQGYRTGSLNEALPPAEASGKDGNRTN